MTTATAIITWFEDETSGRTYYRCQHADGSIDKVPCENINGGPITAASDSGEIADMFGLVGDVDHDGDTIFVTIA